MLINGYVREFQNELKDTIIPTEINDICCDFHGWLDQLLSHNVIDVEHVFGDDPKSALGEIEIESMGNNTIYTWILDVSMDHNGFAVGLAYAFDRDESKEIDITTYSNHAYNYHARGFLSKSFERPDGWVVADKLLGYGPKLKKDRIEMIFDAGKGHLSYRINGKKLTSMKKSRFNRSTDGNVAFSDMKKGNDIKYRMSILFYRGIDTIREGSIKIVSFSMK